MIKKIKGTTIVAYVVHVVLFSAIAYSGISRWGFDWKYLLLPIIFPAIFLYQNYRDYDRN